MLDIRVSREVAEWLRLAAVAHVQDGGMLVRDSRRFAAIEAIDGALSADPRHVRTCQACGGSLHITSNGRPRKFCNDACRQAHQRQRKLDRSRKFNYAGRHDATILE